MTTIYGLIDPRTHELRYVGKTQRSLKERLKEHRAIAQGGRKAQRQYCANWLRDLYWEQFAPEVEIFEVIDTGKDWIEAEQFWIGYWKFVGANLTNHTNGGDGLAGMKRPVHVVKKTALAHKGRKRSEETRALMRASWTPERRAANGLRLRGITMSEEAKAKMSVSGRKRFRSPQEREACRERLMKLVASMTPEELRMQRSRAGQLGGRPPIVKTHG